MTWVYLVLFMLLGLCLVAFDIVVFPGIISGIVGGCIYGVALWKTFNLYGTTAGTLALIGGIAFETLLLVVLIKSKTWRRFSLNESINSRAIPNAQSLIKVGDKGITLSRLAPMGNASFHNTVMEVSTQGTFVDPNCEIEIIDIVDNKVIVAPIKQNQ